jgi:hypothetical protein
MKPLPLTVIISRNAPAGALEGEMELIAGVGLFCGLDGSVLFADGLDPPPEQLDIAPSIINGMPN